MNRAIIKTIYLCQLHENHITYLVGCKIRYENTTYFLDTFCCERLFKHTIDKHIYCDLSQLADNRFIKSYALINKKVIYINYPINDENLCNLGKGVYLQRLNGLNKALELAHNLDTKEQEIIVNRFKEQFSYFGIK